jgi:hypothetical protein
LIDDVDLVALRVYRQGNRSYPNTQSAVRTKIDEIQDSYRVAGVIRDVGELPCSLRKLGEGRPFAAGKCEQRKCREQQSRRKREAWSHLSESSWGLAAGRQNIFATTFERLG